MVKWYWFKFIALPVTVHLAAHGGAVNGVPLQDRLFHWQRICGLQIGPWFFGGIRGTYPTDKSPQSADAVARTDGIVSG